MIDARARRRPARATRLPATPARTTPRTPRSAGSIDAGPRAPARRAHVLHLSSADALPRAARRPAPTACDVTVETCPHYLTLRRRATMPDGAHAVQVLPADPRRREPDALWAALRRRRHRHASSPTTRPAPPSSSASTPATSARPGAASPRCSSGLPAVWTEARRRGIPLADVVALDGARARPSWSGCPTRGASRSGADADLVRARPGRRVRRRPAPRLLHKNPDHAPTPGNAVHRRGPADLAARATRSCRTAAPHGRLLTRGGHSMTHLLRAARRPARRRPS